MCGSAYCCRAAQLRRRRKGGWNVPEDIIQECCCYCNNRARRPTLEPKCQRAGLLPAVTLQLAPQPLRLPPARNPSKRCCTTLLCSTCMQPTAQNKSYTSLAAMATLVAVHSPASAMLCIAPIPADAEACTLPPSIRKFAAAAAPGIPSCSQWQRFHWKLLSVSLITAHSSSVKLP